MAGKHSIPDNASFPNFRWNLVPPAAPHMEKFLKKIQIYLDQIFVFLARIHFDQSWDFRADLETGALMYRNFDCSSRGFYRSRWVSAVCGALCVVALGTSAAQGTILTVSNTVFAVGSPSPTGGIVIASQSQPFLTADYSGTLISEVVAGDPSNALGGLDFLYQLVTDGTGTLGQNIEHITVSGYTNYTVNGTYQTPNAGTIAPNLFDRQVADVIGAQFNNLLGGPGSLPPHSTSSIIVLQTNAPSFQPSFASLINGLTTQVNTYAPSGQPIPEPGTLVLAAIGAFSLAFMARRMRARI